MKEYALRVLQCDEFLDQLRIDENLVHRRAEAEQVGIPDRLQDKVRSRSCRYRVDLGRRLDEHLDTGLAIFRGPEQHTKDIAAFDLDLSLVFARFHPNCERARDISL